MKQIKDIVKKQLNEMLITEAKYSNILIEFIRNTIKGSKFENNVYIAGGYVRDKIKGIESKDIDFVVNLPNGGVEFAEFITKETGSYKPDSNPVIYERFGTAKFNLRNTRYKGVDLSDIYLESVMTRTEKYDPNSRKPETAFGTIEQDVLRRDLTINSLLLNVSTDEILDLTGKGVDDIKNNIIRTPLAPEETFEDDPLRMMRAIRFASRYNSEISDDVFNAIKTKASSLTKISKERIVDEFNKILQTDKPSYGINILMDTGLMKYIIPEYYKLVNLTQNKYHQFDVFNHSMRVLDNSNNNLIVRLSALFHDIGKYGTRTDVDGKIQFLGHEHVGAKMTEEIMKRMGYPNSTIKSVTQIVNHHMRTKPFKDDLSMSSKKSLRKLMIELGDDLDDFLDLVDSDNRSHGDGDWEFNMKNQVKNIREKLKELNDEKMPMKLPISGNKVMELLQIKPSKEVGDIMIKLTDYYLNDPEKFENISDDELLKILNSLT